MGIKKSLVRCPKCYGNTIKLYPCMRSAQYGLGRRETPGQTHVDAGENGFDETIKDGARQQQLDWLFDWKQLLGSVPSCQSLLMNKFHFDSERTKRVTGLREVTFENSHHRSREGKHCHADRGSEREKGTRRVAKVDGNSLSSKTDDDVVARQGTNSVSVFAEHCVPKCARHPCDGGLPGRGWIVHYPPENEMALETPCGQT